MSLYDFVNMVQDEDEFSLEPSDCVVLIKSRKAEFIESLDLFIKRFDEYRDIKIYQIEVFTSDNDDRFRLYEIYDIENQ